MVRPDWGVNHWCEPGQRPLALDGRRFGKTGMARNLPKLFSDFRCWPMLSKNDFAHPSAQD